MSLRQVNSANKITLGNFNVSVFRNKNIIQALKRPFLACAKNFK